MLLSDKTRVKSNKKLRAVAIGASVAALTLAASTNGLQKLFNKLMGNYNQPEIVGVANDIVDEARERGVTELFVGDKETYVPTGINSNGVTAIHRSSPLLSPYFDLMSAESASFVKDNTEWFVFSPDVTKEGRDVNGLHLGEGIVAIDIVADNGGIKNPKTFPSIMGHEAQHGFDEDKDMSTLEKEVRSDRREMGILERQLESDDDLVLRGHYHGAQKRLQTGEFLLGFGSDFKDIDPNSVILAKDLLDVGISPEKLREYATRFEKPNGLEYELYTAALLGNMATSLPREKAIETLYGIVNDPEFKGTIVPVSAASALQYLAPDVARVETGADVGVTTERTASIYFGDRGNTNDVGKGFLNGREPTVLGLPSLEELIAGERFDDFDYESNEGDGSNILAKGELYSGSRVAQRIEDGTKVIYLPDSEGKPGDGFFRFYVMAMDSDRNGRDDTLAVFYGSNSVTVDGSMLAKVDYFKEGKYSHSGVSWMQRGLQEKGEDLSLDVDRTWKDWKME